MVMNSINPVSDYEYINLSNNIYKLIFRTDIQNKNTHYNYNEYTIITSINSDDIDTEISSNFDTYLKMAKLQDEEIQRKNQIELQKKQLSNSDYQVIKCAENYMLGSVLPYDFSQLLATRTELRNKINELESGVKFTDEEILEKQKEIKILEMSCISQTTITNGVDFGDDHYRLNSFDQIHLNSLWAIANTGHVTAYHADSKECRLYQPKEMTALIQTAIGWIIYHTTYFNLLKHQIMELTSVDEVKSVVYGTSLGSERQALLNTISTSLLSV